MFTPLSILAILDQRLRRPDPTSISSDKDCTTTTQIVIRLLVPTGSPTSHYRPPTRKSGLGIFLFAIALCCITPITAHALLWGAHGRGLDYYPGTYDEQMALLRSLGMTSYRVDISSGEQFDKLSALIASARKYNITIMGIITPDVNVDEESEESAYTKAFAYAATVIRRFKDDIHVWEMANETEQYALVRPGETMDDGSVWKINWGDSAGDESRFYIAARYNRVRGLIRGICEGVSSVDPTALRIVNVSSGFHYAFFQRLLADGIKFDLTGCHWYSQLGDIENADSGTGVRQNIARTLANLGKPIWVTESDKSEGSLDGDENAQASALSALLLKFSKISGIYNIQAVYVYELLDEPYLGANNPESYMGLVHATHDAAGFWQIGSPKPAYYSVKNVIEASTGAIQPPVIARQPTSATVTVGHAVNFTGAADGSPAYQWQVSTNGGSTWTNLSDGNTYTGSIAATMTIRGVTAGMNGFSYRYLAASRGASATSDAAILTVVPAQFPGPTSIVVDASGNLYVADGTNNTIQKVNPGLQASIVAGSAGQQGATDGVGTGALFRQPAGLARDNGGILYVVDTGNSLIRKITLDGVVTTFAGSSTHQSFQDGAGGNAWFNAPIGVAVSSDGTLTIADSSNDVIRKLTIAGVSSTFAGTAGAMGSLDGQGTSARFNRPGGVGAAGGALFVADTYNHTIRKISPEGSVVTFAGTAGASGATDGAGNAALFNLPSGIAVDSSGNVYVADTGNATVRKITPAGVVSTLAGLGTIAGLKDGTGSDAWFNMPRSLTVDGSGNVFVADTGNATIRKITPAGVVTTLVITAAPTGNSPTITAQPASISVNLGNVATFSIAGNGNPSPGFQWQRQAAGTSGWVNLSDSGNYSGAATTTLSISGTTIAMSGDQFRCLVSNNAGSATSNAATLSVPSPPANAAGAGGGGGAPSYWFLLALCALAGRRFLVLRFRRSE